MINIILSLPTRNSAKLSFTFILWIDRNQSPIKKFHRWRCSKRGWLKTFGRCDWCVQSEELSDDNERLAQIFWPEKGWTDWLVKRDISWGIEYQIGFPNPSSENCSTNWLGRQSLAETSKGDADWSHKQHGWHDVPKSAKVLFDECGGLLDRFSYWSGRNFRLVS